MKPCHLIVSQQPQQSNSQQSLWMKVNCVWSNVNMYISDVNTVSHIWKSQSTVKMSSSHLTLFLFSHDFYFTCEQWVNYFMMLRDSMPLSRFPSRLIVPISLTCRWLAFWIFNPRGLPLFVSFPVLALCSCLSRPSFTRFECGWVFHIFCILPSFLCFLLFFFYQLSLNFPLFHHLPAWRLLFCCQLNINMWKKPDNI